MLGNWNLNKLSENKEPRDPLRVQKTSDLGSHSFYSTIVRGHDAGKALGTESCPGLPTTDSAEGERLRGKGSPMYAIELPTPDPPTPAENPASSWAGVSGCVWHTYYPPLPLVQISKTNWKSSFHLPQYTFFKKNKQSMWYNRMGTCIFKLHRDFCMFK